MRRKLIYPWQFYKIAKDKFRTHFFLLKHLEEKCYVIKIPYKEQTENPFAPPSRSIWHMFRSRHLWLKGHAQDSSNVYYQFPHLFLLK